MEYSANPYRPEVDKEDEQRALSVCLVYNIVILPYLGVKKSNKAIINSFAF